jgi:hypothetical protein
VLATGYFERRSQFQAFLMARGISADRVSGSALSAGTQLVTGLSEREGISLQSTFQSRGIPVHLEVVELRR